VGKSNILDAIVWVFGEDDLSQLRCRTRDELFFAGSKESPPADFIVVELVFRQGAEKSAPLMTLSRRMSRNGEAAFAIDGGRVRPENVTKELADRGFTHALKAIIRQEQINDLLHMKPEQRYQWVQHRLSGDGSNARTARWEESVSFFFKEYLAYLIPEGDGEIQLFNENGEIGMEVALTLPGNRRRRAHQLSGGEKSITSLALKLAVFSQLECPFILLDEVEPSLDYTNHKSMQTFLKAVAAEKQLIMITHLRSTVELANTVHGVRTRWDGSSFMKFYFVMDERLLRLYKCC
jgi:chromosome segregation protein